MAAETLADAKSRAALAWESAERSLDPDAVVLERLDPPPKGTPVGFAAWSVGRSPRSIVVLPMIDKAAPWEAKERYVARIVSLATGHCWLCDADASLSSDPERTPGAWRAAPVTIAIDHREGCGAVFDESDRALFPVYSGGSDR